MEFGKHIGKGIWAFADKSLPAIYGLGIIFLVVRYLPAQEYGIFVIIQTIVTIASTIGYAIALQPLTKFAAETKEPGPYIISSFIFQSAILLTVSLIILFFRQQLSEILNPQKQVDLAPYFLYIPFLLLASFYRSFAVALLQATYQVQKIFWIDAIYFIGVILSIYISRNFGLCNTAIDLLNINLMMFTCSSLFAFVVTRRSISLTFRIDKTALFKMWDFGKYTFGGNALYTLFSLMDIFLISSFLGVVSVAIYNAAKIIIRFFDIVTQGLSMFLLPYSSNRYSLKDILSLSVVAEKSICFTSFLIIPIFLVILIFPEQIMHLLYKGKYDDSANLLRIFSFLALAVPWNVVASSYIVGIGKIKQSFYLGIFNIAIAIVFFLLGIKFFRLTGVAFAYVLSFSIFTMVAVIYVKRFIPIRAKNVILRIEDIQKYIKTKTNLW